MVQIEEANAGISSNNDETARIDDEDMDHFPPQKSARIKRIGYMIQRLLSDQLLARIQDPKAIIIIGPRQVGKTTLLRNLAKNTDLSGTGISGWQSSVD